MSELSEKFKGKRNWMEKVIEYIPGFNGYLDKNRRREADKVLRDFLVDKFNIEKINLENLREEYTNEGNLEAIGKVDNLVRLLEKIQDKIRYADRGYSGVFDEIKIGEEELEKLYSYDYSMIEDLQNIKGFVQQLKVEYSKETVSNIDKALKSLDIKIDERKNIFISLSGTQ
ncbi:MAG: hypothetical protein PHV06_04245 [bacterium]|nr:hypothetical protein [bacterium]